MFFSRTAYCETCAKAKRPEEKDLYSVIGSTHQIMDVKEVGRVKRKNTPYGYTPHYFWTDKVKGETVVVNVCCGMIGCGTRATVVKEGKSDVLKLTLLKDSTQKIVMPIKEWNAIVLRWKDTNYEI